MKAYTFRINVSYDEFYLYYSGRARYMYIETEQGVSLSVEALHFRKFMTTSGIQGHFRLLADDENKFISLDRI